ncbi:MAG TPA: alpha/beta hydrolase [Rhizobacter sp.]|nr:alpha/beta hydrolase [Rhizobacter sp.]
MTPSTLATADGLTLHLQEWPLTDAHGTVLIVHGLGEHIGRYAHVAAQLNGWGWRVVGYDHRGHGRSQGAKGRLRAADDLLVDLATVIDKLRQQHSGPLVLLGHSMGGLIAARFVAGGLATQPATWHRSVDALVLSSPALAADTNAVQKLLLLTLGTLAPNLAVNNGLKPEWISRAAPVVAAYTADPLVHDRISPRLARFILDGGDAVRALAGQWKLPTLLMFAGSDRCVAPRGSREFAAGAPKSVVTSREFGPLYHEIFNEPEQAEVFEVLGTWMQGQRASSA